MSREAVYIVFPLLIDSFSHDLFQFTLGHRRIAPDFQIHIRLLLQSSPLAVCLNLEIAPYSSLILVILRITESVNASALLLIFRMFYFLHFSKNLDILYSPYMFRNDFISISFVQIYIYTILTQTHTTEKRFITSGITAHGKKGFGELSETLDFKPFLYTFVTIYYCSCIDNNVN